MTWRWDVQWAILTISQDVALFHGLYLSSTVTGDGSSENLILPGYNPSTNESPENSQDSCDQGTRGRQSHRFMSQCDPRLWNWWPWECDISGIQSRWGKYCCHRLLTSKFVGIRPLSPKKQFLMIMPRVLLVMRRTQKTVCRLGKYKDVPKIWAHSDTETNTVKSVNSTSDNSKTYLTQTNASWSLPG